MPCIGTRTHTTTSMVTVVMHVATYLKREANRAKDPSGKKKCVPKVRRQESKAMRLLKFV